MIFYLKKYIAQIPKSFRKFRLLGILEVINYQNFFSKINIKNFILIFY